MLPCVAFHYTSQANADAILSRDQNKWPHMERYRMEHHSSFHTCCKRQRSSPTGKTHVQIEKCRQLEFPDQNRSYKKWSKEEKLAMMEFVKDHGLPSANVNKFWSFMQITACQGEMLVPFCMFGH